MATSFRHNSSGHSRVVSRRRRRGSVTSTSSLYSTATPPSMSRASSEQVSEQNVDTPLDENLPVFRSFNKEQFNTTQSDGEPDECPGDRPIDHTDVPRNRSPIGLSHTEDTRKSYFPRAAPHNVLSSLGYRRSARELISKYEAISGQRGRPQSMASVAGAPRTPPIAADRGRLNSPLPELPTLTKTKGQSPFSFRNLLNAFGKRKKSPNTIQRGVDAKPSDSHPCVVDASPSQYTSKQSDAFTLSHPEDALGSLPVPFAFRTGRVLYLSPTASPPTWNPCSLTLHPSHLSLTYSQDARHITQTIPLLFCVDVVSLAGHQLGSNVPIPSKDMECIDLSESDLEAHVFEMTFERHEPTKERLAVWSVAERGRWVSAIWDSILACRGPNMPHNEVCHMSPAPLKDISRDPPLMVVNRTASLESYSYITHPIEQGQNGAHDFACSIPSLSVPSTPTRRRRAPSSSPSAPSSLPSSPSIRILGSMSIVRQRLANIDAQQPLPCMDSLSSTGTRRKESYVVSSLKRQTTGSVQDGREMPFHRSESLKLNHSATSGPSLYALSPEIPFTALDAHAMYHHPRGNAFGTDTMEMSNALHTSERESQFGRRSTRPENFQYPQSWNEGRHKIAAYSPEELSETVDLESGDVWHATGGEGDIVENRRGQDIKFQAHGDEILGKGVLSLVEMFHAHAAEQSSHTSHVIDKLASIDDGVDTMAANLKDLSRRADNMGLVDVNAKLDQIKQGLDLPDGRTVHQLLDDIASTTRSSTSPDYGTLLEKLEGLTAGYPSEVDLSPVLTKLEELRITLVKGLPRVTHKLDSTKNPTVVHPDMTPLLAKMEDIMAAVNWQHQGPGSLPYDSGVSPTADLANIHEKLDGLTALCTALKDGSKALPDSAQSRAEIVMHNLSRARESLKDGKPEAAGVTETIESNIDSARIIKLLDMFKDDQTSRTLQAQQQAESVRYLNELNSWLENFANSVGQMQQVATGVDQLCRAWLPVTAADAPATPSINENEYVSGSDNLLTTLHRFLADHEARSQETRNLQANMNTLTETLREDMTRNAEARSEMIRHSQDQERLLNGLAADLTNEIRGERLRFVDAMKDATTVNVAIHVEEFKKVLARLHQEKGILEQQIADLFTFVAKQKQVVSGQRSQVAKSRPLPQIIDRQPHA